MKKCSVFLLGCAILMLQGCSLLPTNDPQSPRIRLVDTGGYYFQVGVGRVTSLGDFTPVQTVSFLSGNNELNVYKEFEAGTYSVSYRAKNAVGNWTSWYFVETKSFENDEQYSITVSNGSKYASAVVTIVTD